MTIHLFRRECGAAQLSSPSAHHGSAIALAAALGMAFVLGGGAQAADAPAPAAAANPAQPPTGSPVHEGRVRHPVYLGLREDKGPADVVLESPDPE